MATEIKTTADLMKKIAAAQPSRSTFGVMSSPKALQLQRLLDATVATRTIQDPNARKIKGYNAVYGHVVTAELKQPPPGSDSGPRGVYTIRIAHIPPAEQVTNRPTRAIYNSEGMGELKLVKRQPFKEVVAPLYNRTSFQGATDEQYACVDPNVDVHARAELKAKLTSMDKLEYLVLRPEDMFKFTDWHASNSVYPPGSFVKISDVVAQGHSYVPKAKDKSNTDAGAAQQAMAGSGGDLSVSQSIAAAAAAGQQQAAAAAGAAASPSNALVPSGGGGGAGSVGGGAVTIISSDQPAAAPANTTPALVTKWQIGGYMRTMATLKHGITFGDIMDFMDASTRRVPLIVEELAHRDLQVRAGLTPNTGNKATMVRFGCSDNEWADAFNPDSQNEYTFVKVRPTNSANPVTFKNRATKQVIMYATIGDGVQRLHDNAIVYAMEILLLGGERGQLGKMFLIEDPTLWTTIVCHYVPVLRFYADVSFKVNASRNHAVTMKAVNMKVQEEIDRANWEQAEQLRQASVAAGGEQQPGQQQQQPQQDQTQGDQTMAEPAAGSGALVPVTPGIPATVQPESADIFDSLMNLDNKTAMTDAQLVEQAGDMGVSLHNFVASTWVNTVFVPRLALVDITIPIDMQTAVDTIQLWKVDDLACTPSFTVELPHVKCLTHMNGRDAISLIDRPARVALGCVRVLLADRRFIRYLPALSKMTAEQGGQFIRAITCPLELLERNPNANRLPEFVNKAPFNVPSSLSGTTDSEKSKMILYLFDEDTLQFRNKRLDLQSYLENGEVRIVDLAREAAELAEAKAKAKAEEEANTHLDKVQVIETSAGQGTDSGDVVAALLDQPTPPTPVVPMGRPTGHNTNPKKRSAPTQQ